MAPKLVISRPIPIDAPSRPPRQTFISNPTRSISDQLYSHRGSKLPSHPVSTSVVPAESCRSKTVHKETGDEPSVGQGSHELTVVCLSDTHLSTPANVPPGDVLVHAGDLTKTGSFTELQAQLDWLKSLPHNHKVIIAGNHDILLDRDFMTSHPERFLPEDCERSSELDWGDIKYLNNSSVVLQVHARKIKIFGSPMTPQCGTFAFQYPPIRDVWRDVIPTDADLVLSHGPPKGYLDAGGKGCMWLLRELWRVRPRAVVFGHIHQGRGSEDLYWDAVQKCHDFPKLKGLLAMGAAVALERLHLRNGHVRCARTTLVNAAMLDEREPALVLRI